MNEQHTKGAWAVLAEECDKPYIRIRGTRLGVRYKIANVLTPTYDGVDGREAKETRANASLIAAAPELLEFAQKFLNDYQSEDGMLSMNYYAREAYAAIAKATGEQK